MSEYTHGAGLHKIVNGVAIRTPLAKKRELALKYRRAGIPEILIDVPMSQLLRRAKYKTKPSTSKLYKKPRLMWIKGSSVDDVVLCRWAYMIRAYIDKGCHAHKYRIGDIINARFDRDENKHIQSEIKELPLLVVDLMNCDHHKWLPTILGDIYAIRSRMKATTIYISDEDVVVMHAKYGESISNIFKDRKSIQFMGTKATGAK